MLETECHRCIQQLIDVALCALVVEKFLFGRALEACKTQQALRIIVELATEQHGGSIVQFAVMQQVEFFEYDRKFFRIVISGRRPLRIPALTAPMMHSHRGRRYADRD